MAPGRGQFLAQARAAAVARWSAAPCVAKRGRPARAYPNSARFLRTLERALRKLQTAAARARMERPMRTLIKHVLASTEPKQNLTVKGWVRTRRDSKGFSFLELNDGSCLANLQIVVDAATPGAEHLPQLTTGASAVIEGNLVTSPAQGQKWELRASRLDLI